MNFGHLIYQFLQDVSNWRTDVYGKSIRNRCQFGLAFVQLQAVGRREPFVLVHGIPRRASLSSHIHLAAISDLVNQYS